MLQFLTVWSLSQCYKSEEFNSQCPVCSEPFNKLSVSLPFSHCSQSYLICSLSGQPMNEDNPPMALPNGYIYGEQVRATCALPCTFANSLALLIPAAILGHFPFSLLQLSFMPFVS